MMRRILTAFIVMSVAAPMAVSSVFGQQLMIYPANGQSADQQAMDHAECNAWATQQTGFDPAAGVPATSSSGSSGGGEVVGGAAKGALLGVVGGAIAGDAGKGAAIGAGVGATGGLFNRMGANREHEQQQQQAQAQYQGQLQQFNRGVATCLTGRGYTVS